jgi:hypothetical protein
MNETEWLRSKDPKAMVQWLCGLTTTSNRQEWMDRKWRLWADACRCGFFRGYPMERYPGWETDEHLRSRLRDQSLTPVAAARGWAEVTPYTSRASFLRCIFGNPFRFWYMELGKIRWIWMDHEMCVGVDYLPAEWLSWNNGTVLKIAESIDSQKKWEDLPVLADALEEAGCDCEDLLRHLRGWERCWMCVETRGTEYDLCSVCGAKNLFQLNKATGWVKNEVHMKGCWALEMCLNRESVVSSEAIQ